MSPFDGAFARTETQPVATDSKWKPDDPSWRIAADNLSFELERFKRGMLSDSAARRVRLLLQTAHASGVVKPEAADNARRLATIAWAMVSVRMRATEPRYPKNHQAASLERFAESNRAWESELLHELRRAPGLTLRKMSVSPSWERVVRALRRSSGPPPSALRLAHRVLIVLANATALDLQPGVTATLTPKLEALLQAVAEAGALKPLLKKRLLR